MPLPLSRNNTYGVGVPPFSVDMNAIQDAIIGKKHGAKTLRLHGSCLQPENSGVAFTRSYSGYTPTSPVTQGAELALPFDIGAKITAIRVYFRDAASQALQIQLLRCTESTNALTQQVSGNSAANGTYQSLALALNETVATGVALVLRVIGGGTAAYTIHSIEIDYYNP